MTAVVLPLVLGASFGVVSCMLCRYLALTIGFVNQPNPIVDQHTEPIAYLGGLGIAAGAVLAGLVLHLIGQPVPVAHLWPSLGFLVFGSLDDGFDFEPASKLSVQALLVAGAVAAGCRAGFTGFFYPDLFLSFVWILTLINAINFIDVCDGLLATVSVVTFLFLAIMNPAAASPALLSMGACLGFLVFNAPPATMFAGDGGSHFLGFVIAAMTLDWVGREVVWPEQAQMVLLVAVPLFELIFITAVRIRKGLPWWKGSPDHFSLRLQAAGFSRLVTVALASGAAALAGLVALLLPWLPGWGQVLASVSVMAIAACAWRWLLRWEVGARGGQ